MKQTISLAAKCFLSVLIVDFMCFFIHVSLVTVGLAVAPTEVMGYQVYIVGEDDRLTQSHVYYISDGEDLKSKELEDQGVELKRDEMKQLTKSSKTVVSVLTTVCSFGLLFAFIYSKNWTRGDKDNNLAVFGHMERDGRRGLKIGLWSVLPMAVIYILLLADKIFGFVPGIFTVFKIVNYYMFFLTELFAGGAVATADISWGGMAGLALSLVFVPAFAAFGYYCGNNEISLREKFIYKKKEKK